MHWTTHLEGGPRKVNHAAACIKDKIYSFGGYCSTEEFEDWVAMPVYVLDTNDNRWSVLKYTRDPDLPYQRYGHTVVAYDEKIYLWGGRNNVVAFKYLCIFNPATLKWTTPETTGCNIHPKDGHSACVVNGVMYIFAGFENVSVEYSQEVHALDLKTLKWSLIKTTGIPPSPRDFHSATAVGTRMYVYGGRSPDGTDDDELYCPKMFYLDTITNEWHCPDATGDIPKGRRSHSAWLYNGEIYIFGGYCSKGDEHFNDLYKFSPTTCIWTLINVPGDVPCKRRRQSCILCNEKLYLFGGTTPHPIPSEELIDKSDLHVLDYKPSLRTLCIITALKHKLNLEGLPNDIMWDIKAMTTPNDISRPLPHSG